MHDFFLISLTLIKIFTMTRQKIKDVAIVLFNQNGFGGASMRDIAHKAGIEAASIYNHFTSKQDLLHAICSETLKSLTQSIQEAVNSQKTAVAQIEAYIDQFAKFQSENSSSVQACFTESRHLEGNLDKSFKKQMKVQEDLLAELLRKGVSSKKLVNYNSEVACTLIVSALRGKIQSGRGTKYSSDQIKAMTRMIMDGLLKR